MRRLNCLSIIIPCHNEQEVLEETHQRMTVILQGLLKNTQCRDYEILYVNDGSKDGTQNVLDRLFQEDKHVRVVVLRRNFGLQGALCAGLAYSKGDAAVTIDADLQDPPEKIGEMITYYEQGYDLVLGVREDRQSDTFFKRFTAEGFYSLIKFMGVDIVHNHGDFRLMARPLVEEFNKLTESNRFIRALILSLDDQHAQVFYKRQPRMQGTTKFSVAKMLSFSLDGILSFSFMPLRMISIVGFIFCMLAMAGCAWILYAKITNIALPGWTSIILPLFIFNGLQMLSLGIFGEYLGRLYVEVKQRPLFSIRQELTHS